MILDYRVLLELGYLRGI
ncbi:Protein of unknown function [Pyronema omphalodes CBS 100304]|uniref:Uncharacterized protein n=1 Tax=Pyronema omphalodes (strain CBS 100304) TaxID=1076935 RepID=U4KWF7_PYROM|nr:Protein of unknown function [Pyronema omphalodes CBS 100304]